MDEGGTTEAFLFGAFRLDRRAGALFRRDERGAAVPVAIGSRGFAVLDMLVARHGELVSKNEIMRAVWSETVVEDNNLTVQITALRRVLDHGRAGGSCIQTIHGRGYRFVAPVKRVDTDAHSATQIISDDGGRSRPRLSIVVLPFTNLTDDREQQYFADAITEDLTTDLSRIGGMLVISRNTAFTYRNKTVSTRQIGQELGVRYVAEGSVRRSGTQVRVVAQLIDAQTDAHLWAERFDGDADDLFALQDDVVRRIAIALGVEIPDDEATRPVPDPDAVDCLLRGRAEAVKLPSNENSDRAIEWYERALSLDPDFAEAQARLATTLAARVLEVLPGSSDSDLDRAEGLARQAVTISPRSARTHFAMGTVLRAQRRYAEAILEYEVTLALDRNFVTALAWIGTCKIYTGPVDDAIPYYKQAIRLSPRDPYLFNWYFRIGHTHLLGSRLDEAIEWLEKARNAGPTVWYIHFWLAAAYTLNGFPASAQAALREAKTLQGAAFDQAVTRLHGRFVPDPASRARREILIRAGLSAANSTF